MLVRELVELLDSEGRVAAWKELRRVFEEAGRSRGAHAGLQADELEDLAGDALVRAMRDGAAALRRAPGNAPVAAWAVRVIANLLLERGRRRRRARQRAENAPAAGQ